MPPRTLVAVVGLLAAFALVSATGCGGDESSDVDDYEASVVEIRDRVDTAFGSIAEAQNREQFSDRMEQAGVAIGRAASDLGEKDIPEQFEDETNELEAALHQLSTDLESTAEQLRLTPELFNSVGLGFEGWTKANQVLQSLGKQGVSVEPLQRH